MESRQVKQTLDYLKDIIVVSTDPEARRIAHAAALNLVTALSNSYVVEGINIPSEVYKTAVLFMHQDKKIQAIKELRSGVEGINLSQAKKLCEEMSYVEKIPTRSGYGYDEENNRIEE